MERQTVEDILKANACIKLDLGCGAAKQQGFVGVDQRDLPGVDIVWDLNNIPWPLPAGCVGLTMCSHIVEHISRENNGFIKFMDEIWRVSQDGAQLMIATPYASSTWFYQDPTHVNPCNENTFLYFDPDPQGGFGEFNNLWEIYRPKPWRIEILTWNPVGNLEIVLRKRKARD
jgi:hypothetical protein